MWAPWGKGLQLPSFTSLCSLFSLALYTVECCSSVSPSVSWTQLSNDGGGDLLLWRLSSSQVDHLCLRYKKIMHWVKFVLVTHFQEQGHLLEQTVVDLWVSSPLRKVDSPSLRSHRLSTAPQVEARVHMPFFCSYWYVDWLDLMQILDRQPQLQWDREYHTLKFLALLTFFFSKTF